MSPYIPALNEILRQSGTQKPKFPDNPDDLRYLVLYPDDYEGHGIDVEGNVALLVNEENAREIERLATQIVEELDEEDKEQ